MKTLKKNKFIGVAALGVLLLLGCFVQDKYTLDILITTLYFTSIAAAWNIMCGYEGNISLGHAAFMGVGQYTMVILYTKSGLSPWIGMVLGMLLSMLLALLVGLLALRLKGFYFSLATIALATIIQIFALRWVDLTGGAVGITIPYEPSFGNMIFKGYLPTYILFAVLLIAIVITTLVMSKAKLGSNLIAIREDELAASALGINTYKSRVYALLLSAAFTSIAGCFYAMYTLFIDPYGAFNAVVSQKAAILSIIGGAGTVAGPIIGGFILGPMEIFLRTWLGSTYQGAYLIIYGIILVVVVLVIPNGIYGTIKEKIRLRGRKEVSHHYAK